VAGGTWTVNRASGWNVNGGVMDVPSGTAVTSTTVSGGGGLVVESGGTADSRSGTAWRRKSESGGIASGSFVKAGGTELLEPGGTISGATVSSGGTVRNLSAASHCRPASSSPPAHPALGSGEVFSGFIVSSGLTLKVLSFGTDLSATVSAGGVVASGGFDSATTILKARRREGQLRRHRHQYFDHGRRH
jgi:autotransporter passenger strand-loop-strand repeat protein